MLGSIIRHFYEKNTLNPLWRVLRVLTWAGIVNVAIPLKAQLVTLPEPESITDRQGLPQAFVPGIVQDHQGFIWMATLDGLCRYDGHRFNVFQPATDGRSSLSSVGILHLKPNQQGQLWVAGERSLDLFDPLHETFINVSRQPFYKPFADYRLSDIYPGRHKYLWLVFLKQGIARINLTTQQIHRYPVKSNTPASLRSADIRSILEDRQGFLWVATSEGLDRLDPRTGRIIHYQHLTEPSVALPERDLYGLHERTNGSLLIVSRNFLTVLRTQTGQTRHIPLPKPVDKEEVVRFAVDRQGNDYVTYGNQLLRFNDPHGLQTVIHSSGNWQSRSLYIDQSNVLWLGTNGSGVRQFNLQATRFAARPYSQNFHTDLLVNQVGVPVKQLPRFPSNVSDYNFRYTLDGRQRLWFNLGSAPFYQLDLHTRTLTTVPVPVAWEKTDLSYPVALTTDPAGKVWAVCDSAAMWYDEPNGHWQAFPYRVKPSSSQLNGKTTPFQAVVDDQALWVSTGSQGLFRVDRSSGHIRQFAHQPGDSTSLSSNTLFCLSSDPDDPAILWIGTFGGGLCRFDKRTGRCQRFTKRNGLPNNVIYAAIPDQQGNLWIATNQGLCRMSRRAEANRPAQPLQLRTYNRKDGLLADEFNRFHFLDLPDERIILGGLEGIISFYPSQVVDDTYQPQVEVTGIQINNRLIQPGPGSPIDTLPVHLVRQLSLAHNQNFLTVVFAALQYNNRDRLRYRYQLDGIDNDWISTDRPEAIYTNLSPGTYTLRLNASNTSGIWSPNIRMLTITIHPPFWATWWAYLLYAVATGGIVGMLFRSYLKQKEAEQLKAVDEMKTRFFSNITHEFRTPLTLILAPTEQMKQEQRTTADIRRLNTIDRNAHQLLGLVNQLMDLSKLEARALQLEEVRGDLVDFVQQLVQSFEPRAEAKGIRLTFESAQMVTEYWFDAGKLERIIYNLVSNALKFTPDGGAVDVRLSPMITLTVSDTGIGIPADKLPYIFDRFYQVDDSSPGMPDHRQQEGTGIGLALVKELVDLQKGQINVVSEVGKGSTFTITLPYRAVTSDATPTELVQTIQFNHALYAEEENRLDDAPVVLLVEDNTELADFIADSLPASYRIHRAANGAQGLNQALNLIPDLVISDVLMPVMNGYTLCQHLKTDPQTSHIPVVLLTAKSSHDSRLEGLSRGADDYITKPFHVQELQLRVRNLLEQRRQLREWIRARLTHIDPPATSEAVTDTTDPFLDTIYNLLEKYLDDSSFGADELVTHARMSRMSLHRKLKAVAGMSAGELIRTYRLKRATQYLQQGYNSSETAYQVGFESPAYFTKCFREMFQLTPTEFAAQNGRKPPINGSAEE